MTATSTTSCEAFMPTARVPLGVAAVAACCVAAALAGCQTPPQNAYAGTVPPPSTGMIGQPAPYASFVATPQGAAYPAGAPVPGPATSWQSAAPASPPPTFATTTPAAPASNSTWSWAQTGNQPTAPSLQQYGNQLNNQFNQTQQGLSQQGQQMANQWQNTANQYQQQPQQWANQAQQNFATQQQQIGNQLQNSTNQVQQQFNNSMQQANTQTQQALQQAWPQQPTQQTSNGNWWPFTSPNQVPPARATPAMPTKY